jgi:carboxymethylenebutenolidase
MRTGLSAIVLLLAVAGSAVGQGSGMPDTVTIASGTLRLRALLWRPAATGPFPAILFNHGSYANRDSLLMNEAAVLGPLFARHGYVFLLLFRRGVGLSADQGTSGGELMEQGLATKGQEERNRVQLELLEGEELQEATAAVAFLRTRPEVDWNRLALVGHSFGGSLSLFLAARDTTIRAAVVFGAAAASWPQSPELRGRLLAAVGGVTVPILFVHAANDYSITPGQALAAQRQKMGKPYGLKIYATSGRTPRDGHNLVYRHPATWEGDVFRFLERALQR